MLAERELTQTARLLQGYLSYRNHFVYPGQFVISPWGYGLSLPGAADGMSFALGPVHLIAVAAAVILLWRMRGKRSRSRSWLGFFLALLAAAVFFASTLSQPLWDCASPAASGVPLALLEPRGLQLRAALWRSVRVA